MKKKTTRAIILFFALFFSAQAFSQSPAEAQVLALSKGMFRWEVEAKFDSVANLLDDKLAVVGSSGTTRGKNEYMTDLKAGKPVHNSINIEEASATVIGTTAVVVGKGLFNVTVNNGNASLRLSYMEVFVKQDKMWKMIALHVSHLAN